MPYHRSLMSDLKMFLLWMCFGICILAVTATSSSFRASLGIGGGGEGAGISAAEAAPAEQFNRNPWQYSDNGPQQYGYADPQQCFIFPKSDVGGSAAIGPLGSELSYRGVWAILLAALLFILSGLAAPALTIFRICALAPRWARCSASY